MTELDDIKKQMKACKKAITLLKEYIKELNKPNDRYIPFEKKARMQYYKEELKFNEDELYNLKKRKRFILNKKIKLVIKRCLPKRQQKQKKKNQKSLRERLKKKLRR